MWAFSLIAEPLYLARYIEKAGSGTLDMIERCAEAGLPSPDFEERAGIFVTTLWRDWLTDKVLAVFDLNERQKKAVSYLKTNGRISNSDYQEVTNCIKKTATRDLKDLKDKGIIRQVGHRGPGVHYVVSEKGDIMGTMGTFSVFLWFPCSAWEPWLGAPAPLLERHLAAKALVRDVRDCRYGFSRTV